MSAPYRGPYVVLAPVEAERVGVLIDALAKPTPVDAEIRAKVDAAAAADPKFRVPHP